MASTLFEEDVVRRIHRGALQLGLVVRNYDGYSSLDESEDEEEAIKKGYVRVAWYPKGREEVVGEGKVILYDRSLMPGDAVRRNMGDSQRGIVRSVSVSCHLQVVRTKQMIYDIRSQDLEHIMMYTPSRHVVMGSWVGVVRNLYVQLIVCLKNGARCALSDDSACRLTDVHDYTEEDSVFSCDGFFPGQVLRGPATTFKNATWLSGQQPILSSKASFTVTVEEVKVTELEVHWQTRGLWKDSMTECTDPHDLQPPPRKVTEDMLSKVKPLSYFIAASTQIGDKVMYRVRLGDLEYPRPVPRGNISSFLQPPRAVGSPELSMVKGGELDSKTATRRGESAVESATEGQGEGFNAGNGYSNCTEEDCTIGASCGSEEANIGGTLKASSGVMKASGATKAISTTHPHEVSCSTMEATCSSGTKETSSGVAEAITSTQEVSSATCTMEAGSCTKEASSCSQEASSCSQVASIGNKEAESDNEEARHSTNDATSVSKATSDVAMEASGCTDEVNSGTVEASSSINEAIHFARNENFTDLIGYVDEFLDSLGKLQAIKGKLSEMVSATSQEPCSENIRELSGAACANLTENAEQTASSGLRECRQTKGYHESKVEVCKKEKQDDQATPRSSQDIQELLARAEQPNEVHLFQDVGLLRDIRTLMQNASEESANDISSQVRRLLQSHGKLQQQMMLTEDLLSDSKVNLKELDDIEMEILGASSGKPPISKSLRRVRGMMSKNRHRRKCDGDRQENASSDDEEDEDDDSSEGSEHSDAASQTDSNASSKGESRRHKVVSSLLHRHTKKQHMRLAPKRRPPPKPLESGERVCVEVTHTWTLADVMWQDGTLEKGVASADLVPVHQLDELEFFPGDFVTKNNEDLENVYGLVRKTDHKERTCLIQWIMRPNQQCNVPKPINTEEVSVYELTPHPDFTFNVGDIIVRIADSQRGIATMKKGKSDIKLSSPSTCSPLGASGIHIGIHVPRGNRSDPHRIDCTQIDAHIGNNITHMSEQISHIGDSAQMSKATVGSQLGNHVTQIGTLAIDAGLPVTKLDYSDTHVKDHESTSNTTENDPHARFDNPAAGEDMVDIPSNESAHITSHVITASIHSCLSDSTPEPSSSSDSQLPKEDTPALAQKAEAPLTNQGPHASDEQGLVQGELPRASHDSEIASVDRMNLANLKMGNVTQAENCLSSGCKPSEIRSINEDEQEGVPCAGQVRWINTSGEIHVAWVDGSECAVLPQDLYKLEEDSDSDWSDNDHDDAHWKDDDQLQDSSNSSTSSWETASDASGIGDELNITSILPNDGRELSKPSSSSQAGDALSLKPKEECNPRGSQGQNESLVEQTLTALRLINEEMRQLGESADSILEDQTEMSRGADANLVSESSGACHLDQRKTGRCSYNGTHIDMSVGNTSSHIEMSAGNTSSHLDTCSPSQSDTGDLKPNAEKETMEATSSQKQIHPVSMASSVEEPTYQQTAASSQNEDDPGVTEDHEDSNLDNQDTIPKSSEEDAVQGASAQACDNFFLMEEVTQSHQFNSASIMFEPEDPKQFSLTMRREMRLLQTSLPQGIRVKGFANRMDLFSVLFEGPRNTPYENGLFYFDARLPKDYPRSPPIMHYHAYCSGRLNPNLYNDGKVCISLLGTWTGKGSEMWISKSNLLQVLVSIQGLILVSEPYYNEAGYEKHRGSVPGMENSRLYNETAILKMVQSMTLMLSNPPEVFDEETVSFCRKHGHRMIRRIEYWLSLADGSPGSRAPGKGDQEEVAMPAFPLLPLSKGFVLSTRQALRAYRAALGVDVVELYASVCVLNVHLPVLAVAQFAELHISCRSTCLLSSCMLVFMLAAVIAWYVYQAWNQPYKLHKLVNSPQEMVDISLRCNHVCSA